MITKKSFMKENLRLLREFGVEITKEIEDKIESFYPNEIAVGNYTRKLILDSLK